MKPVAEIQLVPVAQVSLALRARITNAVYADYYVPVHVTEEQVAQTDLYYDVDVTRSVVARTPWEPVGIALLARRGERGWITGVGVMPEWRRRGVARLMMAHLIREARGCGVQRLTLEVITRNSTAYNLYRSLGFCEQRELLCWQRPAGADPLPLAAERLVPAPAAELLSNYVGWHEQPACWQREIATLRKMIGRLKGYRLNWKGYPAAYCLVQEAAEGVTLHDIGVNPVSELLMPERTLLQTLATLYPDQPMAIMNVPAEDTLNRILPTLGFRVTVHQLEMALDLDKT